jgi:hypothetical protein
MSYGPSSEVPIQPGGRGALRRPDTAPLEALGGGYLVDGLAVQLPIRFGYTAGARSFAGARVPCCLRPAASQRTAVSLASELVLHGGAQRSDRLVYLDGQAGGGQAAMPTLTASASFLGPCPVGSIQTRAASFAGTSAGAVSSSRSRAASGGVVHPVRPPLDGPLRVTPVASEAVLLAVARRLIGTRIVASGRTVAPTTAGSWHCHRNYRPRHGGNLWLLQGHQGVGRAPVTASTIRDRVKTVATATHTPPSTSVV